MSQRKDSFYGSVQTQFKKGRLMILYPTIELQAGRCVSLFRGRLAEPQIWHVNPVEMAQRFSEAGAEWLHVTDFDGVVGSGNNNDIVEEIIRHAKIPVQLGGGFRTLDAIASWIDKGAGRIVVSTLAVINPELVKQAAKLYPDQIVIAVDIFEGKVMTHGWQEPSTFEPQAFVESYTEDPLAAVIITDIDVETGDKDASFAMVTDLAIKARVPVISRGLVRSLDDIATLKYMPSVSGAIIGRSLFDRSIELSQALDVAQSTPEKTAEFM